MTSAGTTQEKATSAVPDPAAAVLYVCARRGKLTPGLAAERAEEEGQSFAQERGLTITEVVKDEYGEPDPCRRTGWLRVRELAEAGEVATVIVRWPSSIAPEASSELRYRETRWLREHGVRVRYTWEPLVATDGGEDE
ncbi:hypothetical protein [Streptomyces sp. DH10]|uniref:hypothetical protein n=1 Tax=Streptomyces sp. DH10 TaxID=3040121 RepID=UPI0024433326|nr:hypothetical protein [Streptomyces sp. DH10]MDG9709635.1 hypothetical protein [Streptomyces sp. DH10]